MLEADRTHVWIKLPVVSSRQILEAVDKSIRWKDRFRNVAAVSHKRVNSVTGDCIIYRMLIFSLTYAE